MALPNSGNPISLGGTGVNGNSVNVELGYSSTAAISLNDSAVRSLFAKNGSGTTIAMSDGYGKSNVPAPAGLTVTQYSVATINISWTASTYRYRVYSNSSLVYDSTTTSTNNTHFLSGLSSATSYTIDVAFVNSGGSEGPKTTVVQSTRTRVANATGGTITYSGIYQYHKFTASGTFTLTQRTTATEFYAQMLGGGNGGQAGYSYTSGPGPGGNGGRRLSDNTSYNLSSLTLNSGYTVTVGGSGSLSYIPSLFSSSYVNTNAVISGYGGTGASPGTGGITNLLGESVGGGGGSGGYGAAILGGDVNNGGGPGGSGVSGGANGGDGGSTGYPNGCGPFGNDGQSGFSAAANRGGGGGGGGEGSDGQIDDGCCYPCGNPGRGAVGGSGGGGGSGFVIIRIVVA